MSRLNLNKRHKIVHLSRCTPKLGRKSCVKLIFELKPTKWPKCAVLAGTASLRRLLTQHSPGLVTSSQDIVNYEKEQGMLSGLESFRHEGARKEAISLRRRRLLVETELDTE